MSNTTSLGPKASTADGRGRPVAGPDIPQKEAAILGAILSDVPDDLPPYCARLIENAPDSFDDLMHGAVALAIKRQLADNTPVTLVSVAKHLTEHQSDLGDSTTAFILNAVASAVPMDLAELEAATIWKSYQQRRAKSVLSDAQNALEAAPQQSENIIGTTIATLEHLTTAGDEGTSANNVRPWIDAGQMASDADILIGPGRWITRGAGVLVVGYTGVGKSTWSATQAFSWALGRESLGMRPTAPLKSLIFQAEDDDGDLALMANGILGELAPTEADRELLRQNVLVATESAATGTEFLIRQVASALRRHAPDLLWLNPLSTYFGSDLNDQREVAGFFRNTLNPLLLKHRCACFTIHHCPKPSKERGAWTGGQLAYAGAGSADLANWAREVITLRETPSLGLFEMSLAKRWRKVGWTDAEGRPTATRLIAHDRTGGQVWHDATSDILADLGATQYSDGALMSLVPEAGIDRAELVRKVADTFSLTERTAAKYVADARRDRRRNRNGSADRYALLDETTRPRREVYPEKPGGRDVVWLTKSRSVKESDEEALRKP